MFIILKYSRWTCIKTNLYIWLSTTKNRSNIESIATYWSITKSIAKNESIAKSIAKYKSITISITILSKYCNKYCKISKVLQYVLQNFKSFAIGIAILWKYCNTYCNISKYCNKYCKFSKVLQYFAISTKYDICIIWVYNNVFNRLN